MTNGWTEALADGRSKRTPSTRHAPEVPADLAGRVLAGDRRALAQAITLVESRREADRGAAEALLDAILPRTGGAVRLGVSGPPGVGKSTFIEAFGLHLIEKGHRVAVLAVDPSSRVSGGSILGDKTRMAGLATRPQAFIRPSPAGDGQGGVAPRTREALLLCEAAGFDVVIVETIGVGQAEVAVADLTDMFILLLQPAGGDDLQGIKRGIMELADLLLVTKADGELAAAATRTAASYASALRLLRSPTPGWSPPVLQVSGITGTGVPGVWEAVERYRAALGAQTLAEKRAGQARAAFRRALGEELMALVHRDPRFAQRLAALEARVATGRITAAAAAHDALAGFRAVRGD
jgi:LAO/AO transport system kinase